MRRDTAAPPFFIDSKHCTKRNMLVSVDVHIYASTGAEGWVGGGSGKQIVYFCVPGCTKQLFL